MVSSREFLKPLPADCMLGDAVHPSILERLRRISELPAMGVANFLGIRVQGRSVHLAWQWIDGQPLQSLLEQSINKQTAAATGRDIEKIVATMHQHGIVHGNLHGNNVIIDPAGMVHVTHLSPLLYDDPQVDLAALQKLLANLHPLIQSPVAASSFNSQPSVLTLRYRIAVGVTVISALLIYSILMWYSVH